MLTKVLFLLLITVCANDQDGVIELVDLFRADLAAGEGPCSVDVIDLSFFTDQILLTEERKGLLFLFNLWGCYWRCALDYRRLIITFFTQTFGYALRNSSRNSA